MFSELTATAPFVPRSHCGSGWTPALVAGFEWADAVIAGSYAAIPLVLAVTLWRARRTRRRLPVSGGVLVVTALFVLFCGLTHLQDVVVFWWPAYRLFLVTKAATAAVSLVAVAAIGRAADAACRLPAGDDYLAALRRSEVDRHRLLAVLADLTAERDAALAEAAARGRADAGRGPHWTATLADKLDTILARAPAPTAEHAALPAAGDPR